jgi:hypothetical protein
VLSIHALMNSPRTLVVLGGAAVIGLGMAVPQCIGAFKDADPNEHPVDPVPFVPPPPPAEQAAMEMAAVRRPPKIEEPEDVAPTATLETAADGDVEASLKLRFSNVETGERVKATVKIGNRSQSDFYVPGPGEPNHGLAVVVQDADGAEVRRVVETAKGGQLPRSMVKVVSGTAIELPILVVGEDETPLAPGTYSAYVELRPDPRLPRLGLPLWTAPKGPVRSDTVTLVVTAKTSK